MTRVRRVVIVLGILLIAGPAVELIRETIVYHRFSRKLANAEKSVQTGDSEERVKQVIGEPETVLVHDETETWYWAAADHQGQLWRLIGLTWQKGHYTLAITFDRDGRVVDLSDGIN